MSIWITWLFLLCNCCVRALRDLDIPHVSGWGIGMVLPCHPGHPAPWYPDTRLCEDGGSSSRGAA